MFGPKRFGRWTARLVLAGLAGGGCVFPAFGFNAVLDDDIKKHGVELDDKHIIELDESEGWITVILKKRARGTSGEQFVTEDEAAAFQAMKGSTPLFLAPLERVVQEEEYLRDDVRRGPLRLNMEAVLLDERKDELLRGRYRAMQRVPLLRLRAEVLVPAPPNYVRNPGTRYRVTIEGIIVAKDYQRIFEVDAHDALAAVQNELRRFVSYARSDVERSALQMAAVLALRALNESQHLPAEIPLTVLRSKVGQFRIQGAGLIRGEVHQVRRVTRVKEGVRFKTVMDAHPEMVDMADPERVQGPGYRRGQLMSADRDVQLQPTPFNPHTRLVEDTPRAGTLQAQRPSVVPIVETQPGQRGKTLHAAPEDLRPVAQAQFETYMSRTRPGRPSKDEVLGLRTGGPVGPKSQRVNLRNQ